MRHSHGSPDAPGWGRRLLWFVGLWVAGVAAVAAVAYALRWAIMP